MIAAFIVATSHSPRRHRDAEESTLKIASLAARSFSLKAAVLNSQISCLHGELVLEERLHIRQLRGSPVWRQARKKDLAVLLFEDAIVEQRQHAAIIK